MTFEEMFDRIENTENDVLFVKEGYVEKAKEVLEDAGIDSYQATIKDINALGLLKYSEFTKEKIMERIPEEEKNNITFEDIVSTVGNYCESNTQCDHTAATHLHFWYFHEYDHFRSSRCSACYIHKDNRYNIRDTHCGAGVAIHCSIILFIYKESI